MQRKKPEDVPADRGAWSFGQLLRWHVDNNTQPDAVETPSWPRRARKLETFAGEIGLSPRALRFWLKDELLPTSSNYAAIERALFGSNPRHDPYRDELRAAYGAARPRSANGTASLIGVLQATDVQPRLSRLSAEYDAAEHGLLQLAVASTLKRAIAELDFDRQRSPAMTHEEFAFVAAPYVRQQVRAIAALSRSTVTDWSQHNASGQEFLDAQHGKDVRRIFVLASPAEFEAYRRKVFPAHEKAYGAANIFVCPESAATRLLAALPASLRIRDDEDFAIFDNAVAAVCHGATVTFRTDRLARCQKTFAAISRFVVTNGLSLEQLGREPAKVAEIFL